MKLTNDERKLLEDAAKLLTRVKQEDDIKRAQGEHGILGGKPQRYPNCDAPRKVYKTHTSPDKQVRHRWDSNGVCKCGVIRDAKYVKDGEVWRKIEDQLYTSTKASST